MKLRSRDPAQFFHISDWCMIRQVLVFLVDNDNGDAPHDTGRCPPQAAGQGGPGEA